jgi:hypothetical protein
MWWQVTSAGGPIAIASLSPPIYMHTHVRSTCMLWVVLAPESRFYGKTLAYYPRRSTPRNDEKVSYGNRSLVQTWKLQREPLDDDSEFLVGFKRWKKGKHIGKARMNF